MTETKSGLVEACWLNLNKLGSDLFVKRFVK